MAVLERPSRARPEFLVEPCGPAIPHAGDARHLRSCAAPHVHWVLALGSRAGVAAAEPAGRSLRLCWVRHPVLWPHRVGRKADAGNLRRAIRRFREAHQAPRAVDLLMQAVTTSARVCVIGAGPCGLTTVKN